MLMENRISLYRLWVKGSKVYHLNNVGSPLCGLKTNPSKTYIGLESSMARANVRRRLCSRCQRKQREAK